MQTQTRSAGWRGIGVIWLLSAVVLNAACQRPATETVYATQTGLASYYGPGFHGQATASGETFDKHALVAAHPHYPLGTRARITNLANQQSVIVRVIDRGPTRENQAEGVIIDLSEGAATSLQILEAGRSRVRVEVLAWGTP